MAARAMSFGDLGGGLGLVPLGERRLHLGTRRFILDEFAQDGSDALGRGIFLFQQFGCAAFLKASALKY